MAKKRGKPKKGSDPYREFGTAGEQSLLAAPQFIGDLPPQKARDYDFDYLGNIVNRRGEIAKGAEFQFRDPMDPTYNIAMNFAHKTTDVFVNPAYMDKYDKVGNDPDSRDRVDPHKYRMVSSHEMQTPRNISQGIKDWANATSKYFNKKVTIGKTPYVFPKNPKATYFLSIEALSPDMEKDAYGVYYDRPDLPQSGGINSDNNMGDRIEVTTKPRGRHSDVLPPHLYAHTIQHEFGHAMGLNHPHTKKGGASHSSVMAYDSDRSHGARLYPADINAYRNIMGYDRERNLAKARSKEIAKITKRK